MSPNDPNATPVKAEAVPEAVEARVLDPTVVNELIEFLQINKKNVTKATIVRELEELSVVGRVHQLSYQLNSLAAAVNEDKVAAEKLLATSPALRKKTDQATFQDSARHLARNLSNRRDVVNEMSAARPSQRVAWSSVVASVNQTTARALFKDRGIMSCLRALIDAVRDMSRSSGKVTTNVGLLGQNLNALADEIHAIQEDF